MRQNQLTIHVKEKIDEVAGLYYRLVIITTNQADAAERTFDETAGEMGLPVVNVNLELSKRLLELTNQQRTLRINKIMGQIVAGMNSETVFLQNIHLLFDRALRLDPLSLLQGLARNKTIVVSWPGSVDDEQLTYAEQGHPEYRRYPARDVVLIDIEHSD